MRDSFAPYSFSTDPGVPRFEVPDHVTVMDAHCALCARGARWIARNDRACEFRIIPVQSALGAALLRHYGMDPDDPGSWLYLRRGEALASLDAVIAVGGQLGGRWRMLSVLRVLPQALRDWLYARIARNRYAIWGRADLCNMPDAEVQKRLLRCV